MLLSYIERKNVYKKAVTICLCSEYRIPYSTVGMYIGNTPVGIPIDNEENFTILRKCSH